MMISVAIGTDANGDASALLLVARLMTVETIAEGEARHVTASLGASARLAVVSRRNVTTLVRGIRTAIDEVDVLVKMTDASIVDETVDTVMNAQLIGDEDDRRLALERATARPLVAEMSLSTRKHRRSRKKKSSSPRALCFPRAQVAFTCLPSRCEPCSSS